MSLRDHRKVKAHAASSRMRAHVSSRAYLAPASRDGVLRVQPGLKTAKEAAAETRSGATAA